MCELIVNDLPERIGVEAVADLLLDLAEAGAPGGVVGVADGVAGGDELVGEGQADLEGGAGVAETDCVG